MYRRFITSLVAAAAVLVLCRFAAADQLPQLWLNSAAPDFSLKDTAGKKVSLGSCKGSTVILAFWYPENQVSVDELKALKTLLADKKFSGVKVLAITSGKEVKDRDAAKKKFAETGLSFPILFEDRQDTTSTNVQYQVWLLPAFYIVSKSGLLSSPLMNTITEKVGNKSFGDYLADVEKGKKVDACLFTPSHRGEADYKPIYNLVGKQAPGFIATDTSGQKQAPSYYKGLKNVLLIFWSPGCPHCRRELPQIGNYIKKFGGPQNVQVLAVSIATDDASKKAGKDFLNQFGMTFPLMFDDGDKISKAYGVNSVPTLFLIDKKGLIKDAYVGEVGLIADILQCNVAKMK